MVVNVAKTQSISKEKSFVGNTVRLLKLNNHFLNVGTSIRRFKGTDMIDDKNK